MASGLHRQLGRQSISVPLERDRVRRVLQRLHLLRLVVVGDADDRNLGLLDQNVEGANAAAITRTHAVDLVHDQARLVRHRRSARSELLRHVSAVAGALTCIAAGEVAVKLGVVDRVAHRGLMGQRGEARRAHRQQVLAAHVGRVELEHGEALERGA